MGWVNVSFLLYFIRCIFPLKGCIMHTSMIDVSTVLESREQPLSTLAKSFVKLFGVIGVAFLISTSFDAFAQQAPQRPTPSGSSSGNNTVNSNFDQDRIVRQSTPITPKPPEAGMAVDGGTAGVVINNYNSDYNTVTISR